MENHIFSRELVNKIADLSRDIYPVITDMDTDVTYLPEKTALFFGFDSQSYEHFFEDVLIEKVNDLDIEEYTEEMAQRLKGRRLSEELYIRMGNRDKNHMMGFSVEFMHYRENNHCYMILILKNVSAMQDIDPYTFLYGQPRYEKDIARYTKECSRLAVLEVEIDHIDEFNILYGTNFSSVIQKEIALEYIAMMDENKTVYHMNNSKFIFILRNADRKDAGRFMNRIREVINKTNIFNGFKFDFDVYSSCIMLKDYHGETSTILSKLEYMLDRAKERRTRELLFFNDMVLVNGQEHVNIMKEIHSSVLNHCEGFYVEYQPIVSSVDGRIAGAEALVRWKSKEYGVVSPGMFVDWLEDTPAMYEMGNFVMETSIRDAVEFRKINKDFFININASSEQLSRPMFGFEVAEILSKYDFPADHIWLEITERCRNLPIDVIKSVIAFIKEIGVNIALDDYGTGSASSQLLVELPIDEVKIDMSFIKGIHEQKKKQMMVKSIVDFANSVGMNSCIEGIEDEKVRDYMQGYNSTWFQGYCFSKPVSAEALKKMLMDAH
ncbi:EAL domain-containing protein [Agathobacter sp.]